MSNVIFSIITILLSSVGYLFNLKKDKNENDIILIRELSKETPNKLLVEKIFRNMYRCGYTRFEEIEILYNHPYPLTAIKNFISIRYFNKAFTLSKKDGGSITAEFTNNFNTTKKRITMFFVSTLTLIGIYLLNLYFIAKSIESYVQISTSITNKSMLEKILTSPEPMLFFVLFILTSIILFYIMMYTLTILIAKYKMTQLIQMSNLRNIKEYSSPTKIKKLIKRHIDKISFII